MSNYSIYIPHVFNNISNQKIISVFEKYDIGTIASIDVNRKTGLDGSYKAVFIHFCHWNEDNSVAINLRERIENPNKEARLIYDDPWYWILLPNTSEWRQENTYNQALSLEACYKRISSMEYELTKIYKELYKRKYIPINYSDDMEASNIESYSPIDDSTLLSSVSPMTIDELLTVDIEPDNVYKPNISPMTIDELTVDVEQNQYGGELHKPPLNCNLSNISCDDYGSDFELDLESGCSGVDYTSVSSMESKRWMTTHFCGND